MSRFEEACALVEETVRRNFGDKTCDNAPIDVMASSWMAKVYGMELHNRVNDATAQAISGKIGKTKEFGIFVAAAVLDAPILRENSDLRALREEWIREITDAVMQGGVSEKARKAFLDPSPASVQLKVIDAYRHAIRDDGSAPSITEVRYQFLEKNKKALLPKGYTLRRMLTKTFCLPLSDARRGRPRRVK